MQPVKSVKSISQPILHGFIIRILGINLPDEVTQYLKPIVCDSPESLIYGILPSHQYRLEAVLEGFDISYRYLSPSEAELFGCKYRGFSALQDQPIYYVAIALQELPELPSSTKGKWRAAVTISQDGYESTVGRIYDLPDSIKLWQQLRETYPGCYLVRVDWTCVEPGTLP